MTAALDLARAGDEAAFAAAVGPYRRELHVHCYRMLGSVSDADDLLQETLVAAWRGLPEFAGASSLRTWLYRIATRRCLNAIRAAGRRPRAEPVPPFEPAEPSRRDGVTWLEPYPSAWLDEDADPAARLEARDTVELAFIAALQILPPRQTAAVVLCDVLDFGPEETAVMLGATGTVVKGLLQRGRSGLRRARSTLGPATVAPGSPAERRLARAFATAFAADDIHAVVGLLTDDAWLAMPPAPHRYHGPADIAAFLRSATEWRPELVTTLQPASVNRQPAFLVELPGHPTGLIVLGVRGDGIAALTHFVDGRLPASVYAAARTAS